MLRRIVQSARSPTFRFSNSKQPQNNNSIDQAKPTSQSQHIKLWQKLIPPKYHPYVYLGRYDKPIGYLLLYWPCAWGLAISTPMPNLFDYGIFLAGSIALRAAGCVINDIADKQFDRNVSRTKQRPLARGDLSTPQALMLLIPNLATGLLVLTQLPTAGIIASFSILPVVCVYPLMKRYTNYPQLVLGIAFNWGTIIAFLSRNQVFLPSVAVPIYLAGICWTLIYDTIYAYQDITDDERIGVKSTAITWKNNREQVFNNLITASFLLFCYSGLQAGYNPFFGVPIFGCHMLWKLRISKMDINNREECGKVFRQSSYFGFAVLVCLLAANYEKCQEEEIDMNLAEAIRKRHREQQSGMQ